MLVNTDNKKNDNDNDNINGSDNDDANDGKRGECVTIVIDYFGFIKGNHADETRHRFEKEVNF